MLVVTSSGLGLYCGRQRREKSPTLELIGAICATTVLPVTVLGRMEGNTGAVVIVSGLCVVAMLLALTVSARRRRKTAQQASI